MAYYLKAKAVKQKIHKEGKQITPDGLYAIDVKVDDFLTKLCKQFNGHHTRITAKLVNLTGIK